MASRRPRREIPLIHLLPNAMTLGAICAGVTAMRMAAIDAFDLAVAMLFVAAVLDGLDGQVARVLRSESNLGAELDSLADVINFGAAPAIILYFWSLGQAPLFGWAAALVYVSCCALRLARFNVGIKSGNATDRRFFTGVPAPAGALLALAPLVMNRAFASLDLPVLATAIWLALVGLLMVSRLPSFSLKMTIPTRVVRPVTLLVGLALAALAIYPWHTFLTFDLLYLVSLPFAFVVARRGKPLEG